MMMNKKFNIGITILIVSIIGVIICAFFPYNENKCTSGKVINSLTIGDKQYLECGIKEQIRYYQELGDNEILNKQEITPKETHIEIYPKSEFNKKITFLSIFFSFVFIITLIVLCKDSDV